MIEEPQSTGPPEHLDERMEDEEPTPSSQDGNDEDVILVEDSDGEVKRNVAKKTDCILLFHFSVPTPTLYLLCLAKTNKNRC